MNTMKKRTLRVEAFSNFPPMTQRAGIFYSKPLAVLGMGPMEMKLTVAPLRWPSLRINGVALMSRRDPDS